MPINESSRKTRERWPLEFDLTGVPRDNAIRQGLVLRRQNETEDDPMTVTNSFAVDQPSVPEISDINNPPRKNYNPHAPENQFPKVVYHHESGRVLTVASQKELAAALKRGFDLKPSPKHDYSKVGRSGVAPVSATGPKSEEEMSAEELAAIDEADQE